MQTSPDNTLMWEVLVPTVRNDGRYIKTRFHRVWDAKVRAITGGLTILPVNKGQWVSPAGELFIERMIPVRIACTRAQIEDIINMTLSYYEQHAVLAYVVSEEVIIKYAKQEPSKTEVSPVRYVNENC